MTKPNYDKTGEFWMAFADNRLTSSVSIFRRENTSMIKIKIDGLLEEDSSFITKTILVIMENKNYNLAIIDVGNMWIIDGYSINEHAVECIISIISFLMKKNVRTFLIIDDKYIRDVIESTLSHHHRFARISLCSSHEFSEDGIL
ncbi:STAS domain-containing protein [Azospirillaceae bacterium]|nr:hypothetical protein MTCCP1_00017 [uncultured bacterium]